MNDNTWKQKWAVPSSSSDGYYTVASAYDDRGSRSKMDGSGPGLSCSCIGWTRHMPRTDCRHCEQVRFLIMGRSSSAKTMEEAMLDRMLGRQIGILK